MQPLKSRVSPASPIEAEAIALLRSVERYQPPAGQKQRVRMRLLETSSFRPMRVFRLALLAGTILLAAGASAAFGRQWLLRTRLGTTITPVPTASTAVGRMLAKPVVLLQSASVASPDAPAMSPAAETETSKIESLSDGTSSRVQTPARSDTVARPSPVSEKGLVFEAMRALRREGHPEHAVRLLDEYLRRYPNGTLYEEALALGIEANSALGDPRAKQFADRYLASFPQGRFRAAANRARARFSQ